MTKAKPFFFIVIIRTGYNSRDKYCSVQHLLLQYYKLLSQSHKGRLAYALCSFQIEMKRKSYPPYLSLPIACVCSGNIGFKVSCEFIKATRWRGDQLFPAICRHIVIFIFLPSIYKHSQKLSHTRAHASAEHTHTHRTWPLWPTTHSWLRTFDALMGHPGLVCACVCTWVVGKCKWLFSLVFESVFDNAVLVCVCV